MTQIGQQMLEALLDKQVLPESAAYELLIALTDSAMAPAMAGAILSALRVRGVTAIEVRGFARAMRSLARRPKIAAGTPVADVVGTGGDGSQSLNLSTGAALLAAASGIRIAKHGNRSVSSRCGSADVLEALGCALPADEAAAIQCLDQTGFTFLFAPHYHPAMKAVAPVRAALGVRTVFNLLGPLANPAGVPHAVIGAWSLDVARLIAETLSGMDIARMFVVHGDDGWDEPTPAAPFTLLDVRPGSVREEKRTAADFALETRNEHELRGGDAAYNARRLAAVLRNEEHGTHRDALVMGAALVAEVTGAVRDPVSGAALAAGAIEDGRAARLLQDVIAWGRGKFK
jgi:anthranilate phosphoribosyltransferase